MDQADVYEPLLMMFENNVPLYHPVLFLEASTSRLSCGTATIRTLERESLPTGLILWLLLSLLPEDRRLKRGHWTVERKIRARLSLVSGWFLGC